MGAFLEQKLGGFTIEHFALGKPALVAASPVGVVADAATGGHPRGGVIAAALSERRAPRRRAAIIPRIPRSHRSLLGAVMALEKVRRFGDAQESACVGALAALTPVPRGFVARGCRGHVKVPRFAMAQGTRRADANP